MIPTLRDVDVSGKRVLFRAQFDVPLDSQGVILDDTRIQSMVPSLQYLIEKGAKIVVISHNGRPKGTVIKNLSMDACAKRLGELLQRPVKKLNAITGPDISYAVANMLASEVILLENLRFDSRETSKDEKERDELGKELASLADIYVNDSFATAHRDHASMTSIPKFIPGCIGLLLEKEVAVITKVIKEEQSPFVVVLGGAKLKTKIPVLENLLDSVDAILIGGSTMFTFYKAEGLAIGKSKFVEEELEEAQAILKKGGHKVVLPHDVVCGKDFSADTQAKTVNHHSIPEDMLGLDIGPRTVKHYKKLLSQAKTVIWNGPMGAFELEPFAKGTQELAHEIKQSPAQIIICGGDTVDAVNEIVSESENIHLSTGGGASLTLISGKQLAALSALKK